jgi:hypothetical protein
MKHFDERMVAVVKDLSFFLAGQPNSKVTAVLNRMRSNLNANLSGLKDNPCDGAFIDQLVGAIALHRLEIQGASHPSPGGLQ